MSAGVEEKRPEPRYAIRINLSIHDNIQGGYLHIDESAPIKGDDFSALATILQNFHELVEQTFRSDVEHGN